MEKRTGQLWMPADKYGQSLPPLTVNLLVGEVAGAVEFYERVLGGKAHYHDEDFAALNVAGVEFMLHADHTYEEHPWVEPLKAGERRGLGAELRILGIDPDRVEASAREFGAPVIQPATTKDHGWREVMVQDPDGYIWVVGVSTADIESRSGS
ncbi:MAG: VOC family protein [Dehalococcoidia bacterium]